MSPYLQMLTYGASYSSYTFKYYFDEILVMKVKSVFNLLAA